MPSLTMEITQRHPPYMLRFRDLPRDKDSGYQLSTEEELRAKLVELLSLSEDELREIFDTLERMNFVKAYPVDDETYERVFG